MCMYVMRLSRPSHGPCHASEWMSLLLLRTWLCFHHQVEENLGLPSLFPTSVESGKPCACSFNVLCSCLKKRSTFTHVLLVVSCGLNSNIVSTCWCEATQHETCNNRKKPSFMDWPGWPKIPIPRIPFLLSVDVRMFMSEHRSHVKVCLCVPLRF